MKEKNLFGQLEKVGSGLLFPSTTETVHFGDLYRLGVQGLNNKMYSFSITYTLKGSTCKRFFVLRVSGRQEKEKCLREYTTLKILKSQGLPVPNVFALETDKKTIGHPFIIMERIEGASASHFLGNEENASIIVEAIAKTLASVHRLDPSLFSQDKTKNQHEFANQKLSNIRRLINIEYVTNFSPFLRFNYLHVIRKLADEAPRDFKQALVHGDFGPDHVLMTNSGPIVIDWEGASLGDPAYDVGWAYHVILLEGQAMIDHRFVKLKKQQAFRIDLREHFLECYENSIGKVPNLRFYKNLAAIRLLAVFDLYLRPSLYYSLKNIFEMGVKQTFSRTFYTRVEIKSFHDYCVQFLRNEGYLK